MEMYNLRSKDKRTLPEGRRGTSGAIAGSDSMRTDSGRQLNRRTPTEVTRNTTAETNRLAQNSTQTVDSALEVEQTTTTSTGPIRKRTKWTYSMNKHIVRSYYYLTNLETDVSNYRTTLHEMVISHYPELLKKTVQNIMDQKRSIFVNNRFSELELQHIKNEVAIELHIENNQVEQLAEINNSVNIVENINSSPYIQPHTRRSMRRSIVDIQLDPIREKWIETYIEYNESNPTSRPKLPKLKINQSTNFIVQKVDELIETYLSDEKTVEDIHCLIYIGAVTVLKLHKQNVKRINNESTLRTSNRTPPWEKRMIKKVENLRKDINILIQSTDINVSRKCLKKSLKIQNEYKSENNQTISEIIDYCKQNLQATAKRLKRYRGSRQRLNENQMFETNEKHFYKTINSYNNVTINNNETESLSPEEVNSFWKNVWSQTETHCTNAKWIEEEERRCNSTVQNMEEIAITRETIKDAMKTKSNWKGPGVDSIHNYWLKRFESTHQYLAKTFSKIISGEQQIPTFFTEGLTYLIPKTSETTVDPSKFRPITCLPTIYKLLTSIITEKINYHIEINNIMFEEQKGCRRGSRGCKEQLIIDNLIHNQVKLKKRSLFVGYIDYQKAYDTIPHSWLVKILEIYKVDAKLTEFLYHITTKWNTNLTIKTPNGFQKIGNIPIKRGIFQGDSLSGLWFCLAINPLSSILRNTNKGYKITGTTSNVILNHLLYMDDLKLYAGSKHELSKLLKTTEIFSSDIRMQFGIEKCKIQNIKQGQITISTDEYVTENNQTITSLNLAEYYKYLGYMQSTGIDSKMEKQNISSEFEKRLKCIMKTKLSARNKSKAINTFAIPILTYSFGIIKWTHTDLEHLNILMRTMSTKYRMHHPKSSKERFHLQRSKGGQGIQDIREKHFTELRSLKQYFHDEAQRKLLHKVLVEADSNLTALNLVENDVTYSNPYDDNHKIEEWKQKEMHGRFPAQIMKNHIDYEASNKWLQKGNIFSETEGFIIAIQDQVIATKNYKKYILKDVNITNDKCRMCGRFTENIDHIIAGCTILAPTSYTTRHNQVAKIVHQEICYNFNIINKRMPYYVYQPINIIDNSDVRIYWDRSIITDKTIIHNRPDIIITNKSSKTTYLIDITIPLVHNINIKYSEKITKYLELSLEIKKMWKQVKVKVIPIVIGALGEIPKSLQQNLKELNIDPNLYIIMQKAVILNTATITRTVLNINS